MTTLENMLGIEPGSKEMLRAELLAANDRDLLRSLVSIRKAQGLSQEHVGKIMGVSQPAVADFEAMDSNPTLGRIRRYAHAVGALIKHVVKQDTGQLLDDEERKQWIGLHVRDTDADLRLTATVHRIRYLGDNAAVVRPPGAASFPWHSGGHGVAQQNDFLLAS